MRILLLHVSIALLFVPSAIGQNADTFELGTASIKIPAPANFTEISMRFPRVMSRLAATEDAASEILAVHLPDRVLEKFMLHEDRDLEFYTKASIARPAKELEFTAEKFAEYVAKIEKNFHAYLQPDGEMMQRIRGNAEKGIVNYWGSDEKVALNQPRSLGFFDKGERVFSAMLFVNVAVGSKKYPLLVTSSSVNINDRLVFLYAYRMSASAKDAEALREFTKSWTASVIAANK